MLTIDDRVQIPDDEIQMTAIRAPGPGGQNVNKVSSAIHLRFDIDASSLPEDCKAALARMRDRRITKDRVVVIKSHRFRTQEQNRDDALSRLRDLLLKALVAKKPRRKTRPSRAAKERRLTAKRKHSEIKQQRKSVDYP